MLQDEEARIGSSAPWISAVAMTTAAVATTQGFAKATFALVLPAMTSDVLGSYRAAGVLGSANLCAYLIAIVAVSALCRSFDAAMLLKFGLLVTSLGMMVVAVAASYGLIAVGVCLVGWGTAFVWVPAIVVVTRLVPPPLRALAFGLAAAGVGVGIAVAAGLAATVRAFAGQQSWRPVWGLEALAGLVVLAFVAVLLPASPVNPSRELPSEHRRLPSVRLLLASCAFFSFAYGIYSLYLISALEQDAGLSTTQASGAYSILGLTSAIGGVALGRLSDLIGRRLALVGANLLIAGCALAVLTHHVWWTFASAGLFGLLTVGVGTVVAAYLSDHLAPAQVGPAFGRVAFTFGAAQLLAPPVGGWLADHNRSFRVSYVTAAASAGVAAALALGLPRPHGRRGNASDAGGGVSTS